MFLDDLKSYGEELAGDVTKSLGTAIKNQTNKSLNIDTSTRSTSVVPQPDFTAKAAEMAQASAAYAQSNMGMILLGVAAVIGIYLVVRK